ncbi:hypothetical protein HMJ29_03325 [Hymenobacter taeanensis]|uniref:Protein BatD n=1 Tax=Hymenobacter taeanensis TaxID=2735321 RepID=A0A6M6BDF2_9BACT|nr:BatD family protein [Hymenobacter taeanensis]QJX46019.1 hypothetical protein HMJ29_03325 [Hymenobacter taeanensis]
MQSLFRFISGLLLFLLVALPLGAQPANPGAEAEIVLGPAAFAISEYFTISFQLRGAPLERYSAFPEIEGFKKSGKSSTTTTRIVNGARSTELTITQRYAAYEEGEFQVKPFVMTINGLTVRSAGTKLKVGPQAAVVPVPPAGTTPPAIGLLDQLFGKPKPQNFVEPKDEAFLALIPDKTRAYVGEGVHIGLYFYLTPQDQGILDFYNFADQLQNIIRLLRQRTVWEETFDEQEIVPENVQVGGKPFLRYRLYEAELYPLNAQPLTFPVVPLRMVKYRVAKKPEAGLDNRMEGYKTYFTAPINITVLPLPPHPLRDEVPVGDYRLRESISRTSFRTGQTFAYSFIVEGEGNLSALNMPPLTPLAGLEVYGPNIEQSTTRQSGRVGGRKSFQFRLVARRPGPLAFDSLFSLVVFNPTTARYDTLRSELHPLVQGPVREALQFRPDPTDPFYQQALREADNTPQKISVYQDVRRYANVLLLVLLAGAAVGWWRAKG